MFRDHPKGSQFFELAVKSAEAGRWMLYMRRRLNAPLELVDIF